MTDNGQFEVTLRLADIEHLFKAPDLSPLSQEYQAHSYTSGIEFIANELYANTSYERVRATILLPGDEPDPGLEQKARDAVQRYCRGRLRDIEHDIMATRWRGGRALLVSLVALFVFIGASRLVYHDDYLLLQIISEGLSIAGWVALWFPLEMLTFSVWQHRLEKKIYTLLRDMELEIQYAL